MEMSAANEIRRILNEIDQYNKYIKDMKDCKKLDVTICDGVNGLPRTFERDGIEVKGIRRAYEKHIENLEARIRHMKWVESNE